MKKLICLLLAVSVLLGGCAFRQEEEAAVPELLEPVGVKVDTATAYRGELHTTYIHEGSVKANSEELSFEIDGKIQDICVYPGKWVEEGDVLLTLDQTDLEKQLDALREDIEYTETNGVYSDAQAEIDIEIIEADVARLQAAPEPDAQAVALRKMDAEEARLALRKTQELRELSLKDQRAKLAELEKKYGHNVITAPFSGNVFYEDSLIEGMWVQARKPVAYIANPNDLKLVVNTYINETAIGSGKLTALVDDGEFEVEYIPMSREEMNSMILAGQSLTTSFKLVGPEDQLDKVHAGMYGVLKVEYQLVDDALLLPECALYSVAGSRYVYMQGENGARERRDVRTGRSNGIDVQILEGLEEGEVVYVKE